MVNRIRYESDGVAVSCFAVYSSHVVIIAENIKDTAALSVTNSTADAAKAVCDVWGISPKNLTLYIYTGEDACKVGFEDRERLNTPSWYDVEPDFYKIYADELNELKGVM